MLGLVVLLFLMRLGTARRPQPPDLAADCTKPAFKLSVTSVAQNRPVAYTIVGPEGRRYVLGFDTSTFAPRPDGGWDAVPKPGREDSVLVAAGVEPMKGCSRTGFFATPVPIGTHTVTLYELTDRGVLFVDEQEIEVTEP